MTKQLSTAEHSFLGVRETWAAHCKTHTCAGAQPEVSDRVTEQGRPRSVCQAHPHSPAQNTWAMLGFFCWMDSPGIGWQAGPAASLMASSLYTKSPRWPFSHKCLTGTGASTLRCLPDPPAAASAWQKLRAALATGPICHHGHWPDALLSPGPCPALGLNPPGLSLAFPPSHFSLGRKAQPGLGLGSALRGRPLPATPLPPTELQQGPQAQPKFTAGPHCSFARSSNLQLQTVPSPAQGQPDTPLPAAGSMALPPTQCPTSSSWRTGAGTHDAPSQAFGIAPLSSPGTSCANYYCFLY